MRFALLLLAFTLPTFVLAQTPAEKQQTLQYLASLFHPHGPNDAAPTGF